MDRKWIAGAATVVVVVCSGMSLAGAQAQQPGVVRGRPASVKGPEVEGRVRDIKGELVTLSDGTQLTVPKNQAQMDELKPGSMIKATYEERNGKKIVTSLRITEGQETGK